MAAEPTNQRDLVLAPGEFAYVQDETKGGVDIHVGPLVSNLSAQQRPMLFDTHAKKFVRTTVESGIQRAYVAPERWYLVVYNPADKDKRPDPAARNQSPPLLAGHKVILHGPITFTPWPGQMVRLVPGHHLRSDQYMLVRVYSTEDAKANWKEMFAHFKGLLEVPSEEVVVGKTFIVKGTDANFFVPYTGIEVVLDENNQAVRDAVALKQLEYCILIDEGGEQRNLRGPSVVFPKPTEYFVTKEETRSNGEKVINKKFRAIELTSTSGLYIKVTAAYEESGSKYKEGDELFITGAQMPLYFPRSEHMLIKQEDREIYYSVAIPDGEARYVLNKVTHKGPDGEERVAGRVRLVRGPQAFLADPRYEVLVRRILDPKLVEVMYPGNIEALEHNINLAEEAGRDARQVTGHLESALEVKTKGGLYAPAAVATAAPGVLRTRAARGFGGDVSERPHTYAKPRQITLETKYDGAIRVAVEPGYAVLLLRSNGDRHVVNGGEVALLEWDEVPRVLAMSTGTPKSGKSRRRDVYLRTTTKISDQVEVETNDFCKLALKVSYRVRFEGDPKKWFDIEDPVGFLADNLRSRIHHAVGKYSIRDFYTNATSILRDIVLGEAPKEGGRRAGLTFDENGMHIYDVDVLGLTVSNSDVSNLLVEAQRMAFRHSLQIENGRRELEYTTAITEVNTAKQKLEADAATTRTEFSKQKLEAELLAALAQIATDVEKTSKKNAALLQGETEEADIVKQRLLNERATEMQTIEIKHATNDEELRVLEAHTKAVVDKLAAVSPELSRALTLLGETEIVTKFSENLNVLSILSNESFTGVFKKILAGTRFANLLPESNGNGGHPRDQRPSYGR